MHFAAESYSFTYNLCDLNERQAGNQCFPRANQAACRMLRGQSEIISVQILPPSAGIRLHSQGYVTKNIPDSTCDLSFGC